MHGLCRSLCVEENENERSSLVWLVVVCAIGKLNDHCSYPGVRALVVGFGRDCRYTADGAVVAIENRRTAIFSSWGKASETPSCHSSSVLASGNSCGPAHASAAYATLNVTASLSVKSSWNSWSSCSRSRSVLCLALDS